MGFVATYDDGKDAEKRAKRAEKLFTKKLMGDVISACKRCDSGDEPGGFSDFDTAVRKATSAAEEDITEVEFTAFIHEMWEAAKAARTYPENKPCW